MSQKLWDFRAQDFNQHRSSAEGKKKIKNVLDFILDQKLIHRDSEVLDIGCGPGNYALALAQIAKSVVGLDISPNMVNYAREKATMAKASNTYFEVAPWETLNLEEKGWQKKFDLVFASMCPGINSKDTLLKMVDASRGFCFLSSFAWRKDEVKDALVQLVHNQESGPKWGKSIYCIFNILWLLGYYPNLCYHDSNWTNQWELEKAVELYSLQLAGRGQLDQTQIKKIQDYLTSKAQDGLVQENVKAKIAWIYWPV